MFLYILLFLPSIVLAMTVFFANIVWVDKGKINDGLQSKHTLSKAELYQQEITSSFSNVDRSFKENSKEQLLNKERIEKASTNIENVSTKIDSTSTDVKLLKNDLDHHFLNLKSVEVNATDLAQAIKTFENYTQELGEKIREIDVLKKKLLELEYDKDELKDKINEITREREELAEENRKLKRIRNQKSIDRDRDDDLER